MAKRSTIKELFEKLNQNNVLMPIEPGLWVGVSGHMIFIEEDDLVRYVRQLNDDYTVIYHNANCHISQVLNDRNTHSVTFQSNDIVEYAVFRDMEL